MGCGTGIDEQLVARVNVQCLETDGQVFSVGGSKCLEEILVGGVVVVLPAVVKELDALAAVQGNGAWHHIFPGGNGAISALAVFAVGDGYVEGGVLLQSCESIGGVVGDVVDGVGSQPLRLFGVAVPFHIVRYGEGGGGENLSIGAVADGL